MNLRAHSEGSGNRLLYLIERLDIPDKHRELVPVADYTRISTDLIRRQVPDFPPNAIGQITFGANRRDMVWRSTRLERAWLGEAVPPTTNMFEKKLDVPVQIVFSISELRMLAPMIPTLNKMVEAAVEAINIMRLAAP